MSVQSDETDIFEEYDEYTKIEQHMGLSKSLYELDQKGKYIIAELSLKKSSGQRKRSGNYIFLDPISILYNNIITCLSLKRLRLFFCLQFFLDELMYYEVAKTNTFFVEDSSFDICKIYFAQDEWISDTFIQTFEFYQCKELNIHEAMYLICYLKEYDRLLLDVEEYIKPYKDIKRIKSKLRETIHRIRRRHNSIWNILLDIVQNNIN